jgi:hypothetical protein
MRSPVPLNLREDFCDDEDLERNALKGTVRMIPDQYLTLLRGFLNIGTGALVTSGVISSSNSVTIVGIVMGIAPLAWGLFVHSPTQIVKAAEVVQEKGLA